MICAPTQFGHCHKVAVTTYDLNEKNTIYGPTINGLGIGGGVSWFLLNDLDNPI